MDDFHDNSSSGKENIVLPRAKHLFQADDGLNLAYLIANILLVRSQSDSPSGQCRAIVDAGQTEKEKGKRGRLASVTA
jgi:hypothetical protein